MGDKLTPDSTLLLLQEEAKCVPGVGLEAGIKSDQLALGIGNHLGLS